MTDAGTTKWEVVDSYGIPVFTGSLAQCAAWIDPVLGVVIDADNQTTWGWPNDIDADRVTKNDDGSYTVEMYSVGGHSGGELTVRKVT